MLGKPTILGKLPKYVFLTPPPFSKIAFSLALAFGEELLLACFVKGPGGMMASTIHGSTRLEGNCTLPETTSEFTPESLDGWNTIVSSWWLSFNQILKNII